jgi:hypothetical protein
MHLTHLTRNSTHLTRLTRHSTRLAHLTHLTHLTRDSVRLTRHLTRLAGHARGVVILQGQGHVRTVQEPTSQQMHHLQETNDESSGPW